ncbi:DUF222 domain-containing protein [Rathayibacter sp. YIM 133350]|uniref:HNH endonuclease signature motif containing protein n=1 Tax=Rathayibacter sp. YIM 133350 TaxID=3131992 RepID=UPI00307D2AE3
MANPLDTLLNATTALAEAWADEAGGLADTGSDPAAVVGMITDAGLLRVINGGAAVRKAEAFFEAICAAELAARSARERGKDGLAAQQGFSTPVALLSSMTGATPGEAAKLVAVGEATASRASFSGERMPARHPHVAEALRSGRLGVNASALITEMLDRVVGRCGVERADEAEAVLVDQAATLTLDLLARLIKQTEALLDPDGVEPREEQLRAERSLIIREERSGAISLKGRFDPATGAPIKAAVEALVAAELRKARDAFGSSEARKTCTCGGVVGDPSSAAFEGVPLEGDFGAAALADGQPCSCTDPAFAEKRTGAQMRADALSDLARHAIGCEGSAVAESTTVVVRASAEDVMNGTGSASIDGIDQPICIQTARQLMASAGLVPLIFSATSVPLDLGRTARLFSPAQRLALADRDGGCAFPGCTRPPSFCEAHHIDWWERHCGATDISNGVLLCSFHHHVVHRDEWRIRVTDGRVWFIPPAHIDPARRPRAGNSTARALALMRRAAPVGESGRLAA